MNFEDWSREFYGFMHGSHIVVERNKCYSLYETGLSPYEAFLLITKKI